MDIIEDRRVPVLIIGSDKRCNYFMTEKLMNYSACLENSANSNVSPQKLYKSFTNGLQHKLTFIATTQNSDCLMREAKNKILEGHFSSI